MILYCRNQPNEKMNMKAKYAILSITTAVGLATALVAAEQPASSSKPQIILLKSAGKVVAELKISGLAPNFTIQATHGEIVTDKMTGITVLHGSTLALRFGEFSNATVILKADEIQFTNEPPNALTSTPTAR
ncbi:MAG TPA: hypothetical protein VF988_13310 [Verrucomicrobiae bacterium]